MAAHAGLVLHDAEVFVQPAGQVRHFAFVGDVHHGVPGDGRINFGGFRGVGGRPGGQIHRVAGTRADRVGIRQTVATHPDLVVGVGKVRHHVAAVVVGDDDPGEPRLEIIGFGNDPDAGFGSVPARDGAADVVCIDRHLLPLDVGAPECCG